MIKKLTFEQFKDEFIKWVCDRSWRSTSDISKDIPDYVPEFLKSSNIEEFNNICENIIKLSEFLKSTNLTEIEPFLRAAVKYYLIKSYNKDNTTVSLDYKQFLFIHNCRKSKLRICNEDDIKKLASITKITKEEYVDNSSQLSTYYDILSKNNNIKDDTVDLLHELTNAKTTTKKTKADRIAAHVNYYDLAASCYTKKDMLSSPSSFFWGEAIIMHPEFLDDDDIVKVLNYIPVKYLILSIGHVKSNNFELYRDKILYNDKLEIKDSIFDALETTDTSVIKNITTHSILQYARLGALTLNTILNIITSDMERSINNFEKILDIIGSAGSYVVLDGNVTSLKLLRSSCPTTKVRECDEAAIILINRQSVYTSTYNWNNVLIKEIMNIYKNAIYKQ